ncbi:MAG: right-handed parallel beta-helix repeat-containing protein [Candidatus Bathyarchaeia archaeon]|jgi:parallel beta-helix repeat protein
MRTKTIAKLFLTMLIIAFIAPFTLNQANAIINNYIINVDGKVYSGLTEVPGVFDISGSTYTLLGNITGSLTIQKGDIIIDGAGYTFTGSGVGNGIYVYEVNNVTITNINLNNFARLINLQNSEYSKIIACNLTNGMGISLDNSNHTLLTKNTITANSYQGISLIDSSRNTITENSIDSASNGIKIDTIQDTDYKAEYNYIYGNTISSCSNAGIAIQNLASFNTVLNNNVTLCNQGIYLIGNMNGQAYYPHNNSILYNTVTDLDYAAISISSAPYTRIIGNLLNGSEVYGIYLDESWEIDDCDIVTDNTVIDCSIGMMVWTANTTITRNCAIQSEQFALYLLGSNNTIYENIFHSLEGNAIVLEESGNNAIYHNDFFQESGSITVYSSGANIWDNGYPAGGNFWSFLTPDDEYSGAEQDADGSDGIIDTPFTITGDNIDNYPLVKPCNFFAMNITTTEGGTVNPFTGLVYTPKFAIGNQRLNPTIFTNTSYSEPGSLNYNVTQDGSFVVLVMATGYKGPVEEVTVPQGFTQQLFVNGTANCQQVYIATGTQQAGSYVFSATCQNDGEVDYSMAAYVFPPGYYSFVTAGIAPDLDGNYPQSTALSLSSGSYCIFGAGAYGAPPSISMSTDVIDVSCRDPTLEHNLSVIGHQYSRNITLTGYPYLALGGIGITKALSVTATPEGENTFSHWILNGEKVTENPLQLNQTSNQDLTAVFKPPHVLGNWTYAGNDLNAGTSIIQTSDGGYVIAGYSSSYKETYDYDFWLAKISSNGIMQWNHTYGSDAYDYAYSLTESQDGGYVIAGGTPEGAGGIDVWILKTDANGNQVWNKTYGYNKNDGAYGILPLQGGGYMVAGYTTNADFSSDMWLIKIDDSGNQVWNKTYGVALSDEVCYGIVDASGGGYVLAGYTYLWSGETGQDVWLVKVDADGKQLWNQTYGGLTYEEATSIVATEDNGYAVAGFGGSWGERYALLMKVDANGVQDWNQTYGGIADTQVFSLINAQDSGYVLAGFTQIASDKQALLIKTYPNGTEQWKRTYGTEDNDDIARCVIATEEDGYAFTGSEGSDCMLYVVDSNGYIAEPQTYYLTINKNGQGTVTPNSQGYEEGTVVDLEAIPANGWSFSGWSGDVQGSTATTTITMNANKTVTATFTQNNAPHHPLKVIVSFSLSQV